MSLSTCPRCKEEVTLPSQAAADAEVRCPLCQEEYQLSEVFAQMPPALVVISGGAPSPGEAAKEAFGQPAEPVAGGGFHIETSGDIDDGSKPEGNGSFATPARTTRQPAKSRAGREILKVVGGGVVGILMAHLILWWLPGEWSRDPFKFGKFLSQYPGLSLVVPEHFHADPPPDNSNSGATPEIVPLGEGFGSNAPPSPPQPLRPSEDSKESQNSNKSSANNRAKKGEVLPDSETAKKPSSAKSPLLPFEQTAFYEIDELREAFGQTRSAAAKWLEQSDPDTMLHFYQTLSHMGWVATFLDDSVPPDHRTLQQIRDVLVVLGTRTDYREAVERGGEAWLIPGNRTNDGILLLGEVQDVTRKGRLDEARMQLSGGKTVHIVAPPAESSQLQPGERTVLLGTVVENPNKQLNGYEGSAQQVVYLGLATAVGAGEPVVEEPPAFTPPPEPPGPTGPTGPTGQGASIGSRPPMPPEASPPEPPRPSNSTLETAPTDPPAEFKEENPNEENPKAGP